MTFYNLRKNIKKDSSPLSMVKVSLLGDTATQFLAIGYRESQLIEVVNWICSRLTIIRWNSRCCLRTRDSIFWGNKVRYHFPVNVKVAGSL
jgi:hypothetical protein